MFAVTARSCISVYILHNMTTSHKSQFFYNSSLADKGIQGMVKPEQAGRQNLRYYREHMDGKQCEKLTWMMWCIPQTKRQKSEIVMHMEG